MNRSRPAPAGGCAARATAGVARHHRVLAFDFGEQRIGAAVGDTSVGIAHPLTTIDGRGQENAATPRSAKLMREWRPALLVVGLPAHLDGTEHEMSRLARKFARELGGRFSLPVELVDERLTSAAADTSLAEAGVAATNASPWSTRSQRCTSCRLISTNARAACTWRRRSNERQAAARRRATARRADRANAPAVSRRNRPDRHRHRRRVARRAPARRAETRGAVRHARRVVLPRRLSAQGA